MCSRKSVPVRSYLDSEPSLLLSPSLPLCCHSVKLRANLGKRLFTEVRRRGVLRSSHVQSSTKLVWHKRRPTVDTRPQGSSEIHRDDLSWPRLTETAWVSGDVEEGPPLCKTY